MNCFLLVFIALVWIGCGGSGPADEAPAPTVDDSKLGVFVVNYPLQYFAERIGGGRVDVRFPAPSEGDPAFWSPDADTVAAFQEADLILLNGAGYAKWVDKVTLPPSKLVDTSGGFADRIIYVEGTVTHSHGPGGEHTHGEAAFTTWLDLKLAVEHARAVRDAFAKAKPEHETEFQSGFAALESDLLALDESLRGFAAGKSEMPILGSHPVYQYLAARYELNIKSVHFEPDEVPSGEAWHDFEHLLSEHPAKWMLWEGEPLPETAAKLEELGIKSVVFDPCANRPPNADFLEVMKANVANMEKIFP
jgi:zinc transport system substrate-binding protein